MTPAAPLVSIVDDDLSSLQLKNLEEQLQIPVIDRTQVDLAIGELGEPGVTGLKAATIDHKRLIQQTPLFKHFPRMDVGRLEKDGHRRLAVGCWIVRDRALSHSQTRIGPDPDVNELVRTIVNALCRKIRRWLKT